MSVPAADVKPPLGPGDDDPRQQARGTAAPVFGPLGPGDSVPTADRGVAGQVASPLGPGDAPAGAQAQTMGEVKPPLGPGDRVGPEPPPKPSTQKVLRTKYDRPTTGA